MIPWHPGVGTPRCCPPAGWRSSLPRRIGRRPRWGPEMIMIYNDAYAPILGDKHPRVLGAPLREVWPEIYDKLGPLNESILRGEREGFFARDHLWRIFRRADTWEDARFTISYSPIPDDTAPGRIGGILATAVETTDRVDTEQRLRQLSERLEQEVAQRTRERDRIWQVSEDLLGVCNFEGYFLRVRPKTSSRITELSQHEADGGEFQECKRAAVEIFPVLGEAPAAVEPGDRAFDDPTLG